MTLCIAWIRKAGCAEEICVAADSCYTGGQRFLASPKIFPLKRGDCAIAVAGDTHYSYPIIEHITKAIELNQKLSDRACDITDLVHTIVDISNKCLHQETEKTPQPGEEGPDFSMILAGYSWKLKTPYFRIINYDRKQKLMQASEVSTMRGVHTAIIGDYEYVKEAKKELYALLEQEKHTQGEPFDMQPLDILKKFIDDSNIRSIGGYPQMIKIYPYMRILPIGFAFKDDKGKQFITYYGRPLLGYETFPYPIYSFETKEFLYMKKLSDNFILEHEEIDPLSKF